MWTKSSIWGLINIKNWKKTYEDTSWRTNYDQWSKTTQYSPFTKNDDWTYSRTITTDVWRKPDEYVTPTLKTRNPDWSISTIWWVSSSNFWKAVQPAGTTPSYSPLQPWKWPTYTSTYSRSRSWEYKDWWESWQQYMDDEYYKNITEDLQPWETPFQVWQDPMQWVIDDWKKAAEDARQEELQQIQRRWELYDRWQEDFDRQYQRWQESMDIQKQRWEEDRAYRMDRYKENVRRSIEDTNIQKEQTLSKMRKLWWVLWLNVTSTFWQNYQTVVDKFDTLISRMSEDLNTAEERNIVEGQRDLQDFERATEQLLQNYERDTQRHKEDFMYTMRDYKESALLDANALIEKYWLSDEKLGNKLIEVSANAFQAVMNAHSSYIDNVQKETDLVKDKYQFEVDKRKNIREENKAIMEEFLVGSGNRTLVELNTMVANWQISEETASRAVWQIVQNAIDTLDTNFAPWVWVMFQDMIVEWLNSWMSPNQVLWQIVKSPEFKEAIQNLAKNDPFFSSKMRAQQLANQRAQQQIDLWEYDISEAERAERAIDVWELQWAELAKVLASWQYNWEKFFWVYATWDATWENFAQNYYSQAQEMWLEWYMNMWQERWSNITMEMVQEAADEYNVDPLLVAAKMAQDSSMGTKWKWARNNNPGNIWQFDSLDAQGVTVPWYPTLQEWVNAVAENFAKRQNALAKSAWLWSSWLWAWWQPMTSYWVPVYFDRGVKNMVPATLMNSETELEQLNSIIKSMHDAWFDAEDATLEFMWFNITNPQEKQFALWLVDTLRMAWDEISPQAVKTISDFTNKWNYAWAINRTENEVNNYIEDIEWENFISESTVSIWLKRAEWLKSYIEWLDESPIWVASGTFQEWIKNLKSTDAQKIQTLLTEISIPKISNTAWWDMTQAEIDMFEPLIPSLSDRPDNFMIKLDRLLADPVLWLNSQRSTYWLPELTQDMIINNNDKSLRKDLYKWFVEDVGNGEDSDYKEMEEALSTNQANIEDW